MNERGAQPALARPFGARMDTLRGEPTLAAEVPVTPIARRLAIWWPRGAWVYAWPVAVEYPEGTRTRRLRILPTQRLISATCAAAGLAAFATFATQRWRRQRSAPGTARQRRPGRAALRQQRGRGAL